MYQGEFHQQALVLASTVVQITVIAEFHGPVQELLVAFLRLLLIAFADTCSYFQQGEGNGILAYQQIAEVRSQSIDEMMGIESCGMLMSAVHKVDGVEKLNLVMLDDAIPAGAKLC